VTEAPISPSPGPSVLSDMRTNALGPLLGHWVFVAKLVRGPMQGRLEMWAIPLDAGQPRLALSYPVPLGGIPEAIFDVEPYLRRQFSPDGMQLVVSLNGSIVVANLGSGAVRELGVSGFYPSWSPDGSRIAFLAPLPVTNFVPPDNAIYVVPASGGRARELAQIGQARQAPEWSPDGTLVALDQNRQDRRRIALIDVATGAVVREIDGVPSAGVTGSFAHWRAANPQLAITTARENEWEVVAVDPGTGAARIVLKTARQPDLSPCHCPQDPLPEDPRWNPTGSSELLYSLGGGDANNIAVSTHIVDVATGRDLTLPITAGDATWTWDGRQIVYLARGPRSRGVAVRIWNRDNGVDREVLGGSSDLDLFVAIASVAYGR